MHIGIRTIAAPLLSALISTGVHAQSVRLSYAPGTQHYRLTTVVHRSQSGGAGRAPIEYDVTTRQLVTLALAAQSPDTLRLTLTVDSVSVTSSIDAPTPDLAKLRGAKLTGTISPQGRIYSFQPSAGDADPQVAALYKSFRKFLWPFPERPLSVGSDWVDTTTDRSKREAFDVTTTTITSSKLAADTTFVGQRAWKVEHSADVAQSGDGKEGENTIHLSGDGSITGVHYVSKQGVYLGSKSKQRSEIRMTMKDSESAPISQTIESTVELLPPDTHGAAPRS
jgi:hypothetical protein